MKKSRNSVIVLNQVQALARSQSLVITEQQCLKLGFSQDRIYRMLRIGQWRRLLPGVYLTSNTTPELFARLYAALLYTGRAAAISHESAAFIHGFISTMPHTVSLIIPESRRVLPQRGLQIQRRRNFPQVQGTPSIVTPAETVVDLLDGKIEIDRALGYVTEAMRKNVRPQDVLRALGRRKRHSNRKLLKALLGVTEKGVESPLEFHFVRDVETAHGLPRSRKQVRTKIAARWVRSDCYYAEFQLRIELDGEIAHPGGRTDSDTWRDNAIAIQNFDLTLRYRWYHVAVTPCETAQQIASALRQRGWQGKAKRCGPECDL